MEGGRSVKARVVVQARVSAGRLGAGVRFVT